MAPPAARIHERVIVPAALRDVTAASTLRQTRARTCRSIPGGVKGRAGQYKRTFTGSLHFYELGAECRKPSAAAAAAAPAGGPIRTRTRALGLATPSARAPAHVSPGLLPALSVCLAVWPRAPPDVTQHRCAPVTG